MNETDSNADTCCLGKNWIVYNYTTRSADVYPYNDSYEPIKDVPIVTGASAYTNTQGVTYILLINEALYYGDKMDHNLLNPNQIRHNNISYWDNPYNKDHPLGIDIPNTLFVPLASKGTKVQFETRTPTNDELENCLKIDITSSNKWNLHQLCMTPSPTLNIQQATHWSRLDANDDNADNMLLSSISPSLISLKECLLQAVQV